MNAVSGRMFLVGFAIIAASALALAASSRTFELPDHGALSLEVPDNWKDRLQQPPNRLPPTIALTPRGGARFVVLITVIWPVAPVTKMSDQSTIRSEVAAAAKSAESQSVEHTLQLQEITGPNARGFYFSATDRAPKPGEYKYLTQGTLRAGEITLAFTVLTNDGQEAVVKAALEMLRTAVHRSSATAGTGSFVTDTQSLTWLKSGNYRAMELYFAGLQRSYESGQLSDQQLYRGFRTLYQDDVANAQYFDQWVQAYPKSFAAHVARGAYFYRMAWAARGEEFIQNTPPERIERMKDYLARSRPDLVDSLALTAKPYLSTLYLLNVENLNGSPEVRRRWLDRGTSIDPNNTLLRVRYMISLEPRWGGSYDQMRAFIAECAQQQVSATTMAELELNLASDMAESVARTASPSEMLGRWDEVVQLAQAAGEPPPPRALAGYARSAWDLNRRGEADRSLAKLAQLDVNDAWTLSQMGWIYVHEQRMAEGWAVLRKAATLNDAWSQFAVGKTLILGCPEINLPPDRPSGLAWMKRSADQGFAEAIAFLAATDK